MSLISDVSKPDTRVQNIMTEIEKLKLEEITNKTFVDQDIYLDGRAFADCVFKNCRLFVKITGKRIHLDNIEFIASYPALGVKAISDLVYLGQIQETPRIRQIRKPKI